MDSKKKTEHYKKYLTSMHAKLVTPDEVIRRVIKEGTGDGLSSKQRIIAGEVNEVYDITLDTGQHVILRIAKGGNLNFLQEKWAIDKCKKLGVPVPEIILIKYIKLGNEDKSLCLMKKIQGEPLERGKIDFEKLDLKLRRKLINQAGEILSKIHSVKTQGFGWVIGSGKAQYSNSKKLIDALLNKQEQFEKIATEEEIEKSQIRRAFNIIKGLYPLYAKTKPCLNHGDYSHKHFMVSDSKIVAILDWGGVRSDTPIYDFANWDYWFGEYIPTEWLKEGYLNKSLFDSKFDDFLHMLRLFKGLEILNWYHQENYKPAVEKAIQKLIKDLGYFRNSF